MDNINQEAVQTLLARKSVRAFSGDIPETDVQTILRAAIEAPTAGNMTLWSAIRVTDPDKRARLAESCDHQSFIANAPLVIVFCADIRRWLTAFRAVEPDSPLRNPGAGDFMLATVDAVIAAHASVTAAELMGYGSCYIGDILENLDTQREILRLPAYVKPVCMAVYGLPNDAQRARQKPARFRTEDIVFENEYRDADADTVLQMLGDRQKKHGDDLKHWVQAFLKRKWNCDFSAEMTRSVNQMLSEWNEGK